MKSVEVYKQEEGVGGSYTTLLSFKHYLKELSCILCIANK